jgi:ABC-type lipoprotein export system ATPase subunit
MIQATWDKADDIHVPMGKSSTNSSDGGTPHVFSLSGTCSFKHKGVSVIIGPVGSGKSTLLLSLLGETQVTTAIKRAFC